MRVYAKATLQLPDFGVFLYVREDASPLALQLAGIIRDVDFAPSAIAPRG